MQYDNVIDVCIVPVAMYSRERLSIYIMDGLKHVL